MFLPRLAHGAWGPLYAASIAPVIPRYRGKVDVVLGSWAYPDGFAAVIAARMLGVACVVKLHGSDINVIAKLPGPRRQTAWALSHAARVVAVSRALAEEVVALGVPQDRVAIVMNGVDAELFHPRDRATARRELGLPPGPLALYVGNLKPEKGAEDLARAWHRVARDLPDATLAIVGEGPVRTALEAALPPRTTLFGAQPLAAIPTWLAACDVLVLPSHVEGTPNVVLEALACGRRVVASAVGGVPDLLTSATLGTLVPAHEPDALAAALTQALRTPYAPDAVAELGARGGWEASAAALHAVLAAAADASVRGSR
jgi:glycosyltransferase involved in cell wall biosynthesis